MPSLTPTMSSPVGGTPAPLPPELENAEARAQRNRVKFEETTSSSASPKSSERRGRKQTVAFDMHAAPQAKKEVFITQVITLQEVEVAQQQFQITVRSAVQLLCFPRRLLSHALRAGLHQCDVALSRPGEGG